MRSNYNIPILYTVFNRLDLVKRTFEPIRAIRPSQLFIECDGPRNAAEKKMTDSVRKYLLESIDWKCELKTKFRKKNVGSHVATLDAMNWFFENVEMGIILEDDDLAGASFFKFCQILLKKYKNEKKVMSICGHNTLNLKNLRSSYYFTRIYGVWGWATWRDRWKENEQIKSNYSLDKKNGKFRKLLKNPFQRIIYERAFKNSLTKNVCDWTYSFFYVHLRKDRFCIRPKENLVENIGLTEEATRTKPNFADRKFFCIPIRKLKFPLIHPKEIREKKIISWKEFFNEFKRIILKKTLKFLEVIK